MTYGIMPVRDFETMDKVLQLVCDSFSDDTIHTLEIGVHQGLTSRGINKFILGNGKKHQHTGIDNQHDMKIREPFIGCKLIIGNSIEVYNQIEDASQHFIFIDGCHNLPMTLSDFLVYSDKVKVGGYLSFHDTSPFITPFVDYQGMGSKHDADMFISCRKAVNKLGLLENKFEGWELVFDEYDKTHPTGGIVTIKRVV